METKTEEPNVAEALIAAGYTVQEISVYAFKLVQRDKARKEITRRHTFIGKKGKRRSQAIMKLPKFTDKEHAIHCFVLSFLRSISMNH